MSKTARTAIGLIAGPDRPPRLAPKIGFLDSISIAIPRTVFAITTASAPALWAASAISGNSGVLGLSFAQSGFLTTFTASTTSVMAWIECENSFLRSSKLGHEAFISIATTSGGVSRRWKAASVNSWTVEPQMLATIRALEFLNAGNFSSTHVFTPGP